MHAIRCELLAPAPEGSVDAVRNIIRAYNRSKNPLFFAAVDLPENNAKPLHVVAFDGGQIVGGLLGETFFAWLKVDILAVHADHRRRGLGSRLMRLAEEEGRRRQCRHSFLDTMSYQARDFYIKLGYRVAGTLEDWDSHGHAKYLMTKELS